MIDQEFQRSGIGSIALKQLIQQLQLKFTCKEIRTSYARENLPAARFFENIGFVPMDDGLKDEIVAVFEGRV